MKPLSIEQPCVLVVEGKDEEAFFAALLKEMQVAGVQVLGIGGKTQFRPALKALVRAPEFAKVQAVGIVRDADNDPVAAFQSVCYSLEQAGLSVPSQPRVVCGVIPRVAVMILPHDGNGALEDVCLRAVGDDPAMPCVDAFFRCLAPLVGAPRRLGKARVQVFLASRPEEGKRLGEAAGAGYWPWGAAAFEVVREFVRLLATLG